MNICLCVTCIYIVRLADVHCCCCINSDCVDLVARMSLIDEIDSIDFYQLIPNADDGGNHLCRVSSLLMELRRWVGNLFHRRDGHCCCYGCHVHL